MVRGGEKTMIDGEQLPSDEELKKLVARLKEQKKVGEQKSPEGLAKP